MAMSGPLQQALVERYRQPRRTPPPPRRRALSWVFGVSGVAA